MTLSFRELQNAVRARNKEWDPLGVTGVGFYAVELAGEVGEACNVVKKLERERLGIRGSNGVTTAHLAEELADVLICAALLANEAGIDLEVATIQKFNATSDKYGLKRMGELIK